MDYEKYKRIPGSTMCRILRCPVELKTSPWRYCYEHAPEELKPHMVDAAPYESPSSIMKRKQGEPLALRAKAVLAQVKSGNRTTAGIKDKLKLRGSQTRDVLAHLIKTKKLVRVRTGVYALR